MEIIPDTTSDFVNIAEAVTERNEILKSQYGVTLKELKTNPSEYPTKVNKETMSPSGDFQAIISRMDTAAGLVQQGSLIDLSAEECTQYINFNKPWWDGKMVKDLTIDGKVYFATGDILTSDNDGTFALLFNKKIATEVKMPDLYKMVDNGTWTMDQMYTFEGLAINDKNGDGKLSYDTDVCGFAYTGDSPFCITYAWRSADYPAGGWRACLQPRCLPRLECCRQGSPPVRKGSDRGYERPRHQHRGGRSEVLRREPCLVLRRVHAVRQPDA